MKLLKLLPLAALCALSAAVIPAQAQTAAPVYSYQVPLKALVVSNGVLTAAPGIVDFGQIPQGSSATANVILKNVSANPVNVASLTAAGGGFSVVSTSCSGEIAPGSSCQATVQFTPTTPGTFSGSLRALLADGTALSTASLAGRAQALAANAAFGPTVDFGALPIFQADIRTATLTNTSNTSIQVGTVDAGSFLLGNGQIGFDSTTCSNATLQPGQSCDVTIFFAPDRPTQFTELLSVPITGGTATVSIQGTGVEGNLVFSNTLFDFGSSLTTDATISRTITVTNTGGAPVSGIWATADGIAENLSFTTDCQGLLSPNQSCTVIETLNPSLGAGYADRSRSTIYFYYESFNGRRTVRLQPSFVVAIPDQTLDFGSVTVGQSSTKRVTFNGLRFASPDPLTGEFSILAETCSSNADPAVGCYVDVSFTPQAGGTASQSISFVSFPSYRLGGLTVTGQGVLPHLYLSEAALAFPATPVGVSSDIKAIQLINTSTVSASPGSIGMVYGGSDFNVSQDCATVNANGSCTLNVLFTPTASGPRVGALAVYQPDGTTLTVALTGSGYTGQFACTPASYYISKLGLMGSDPRYVFLPGGQFGAVISGQNAESIFGPGQALTATVQGHSVSFAWMADTVTNLMSTYGISSYSLRGNTFTYGAMVVGVGSDPQLQLGAAPVTVTAPTGESVTCDFTAVTEILPQNNLVYSVTSAAPADPANFSGAVITIDAQSGFFTRDMVYFLAPTGWASDPSGLLIDAELEILSLSDTRVTLRVPAGQSIPFASGKQIGVLASDQIRGPYAPSLNLESTNRIQF